MGQDCQTSLGHCSHRKLESLEGKGTLPMPASTKQQSGESASSAPHALPEPAGGRATAGRTLAPGPTARPSVSAAGRGRVDPHAGGPSSCILALDWVGRRGRGWGHPGGWGLGEPVRPFSPSRQTLAAAAADSAADSAAAHEFSRNVSNSQSPREEPPEVVRRTPRENLSDHRD